MKKVCATANMMMEMCMCPMCMDACAPFSDTFSVLEMNHCPA